MQKKLLRVIQENTIVRVGGSKPIKIDVRYISATNITAEDLHDNHKFRQDLYYRLSVIPIKIPPLRERREDIEPLVNHFVKLYNQKYNRTVTISNEVMKLIREYPWTGNIRELKNIVERLVVLSVKNKIGEDEFNMIISLDIPEVSLKNTSSPIIVNQVMKLDEAYKLLEESIINKAIKQCGSITKASKLIGINPSTIHRKIKSGYIDIQD